MATPNLSRLSAEGQFAPLRTRSKIDAAWQKEQRQTQIVDGVPRVITKPAGWEDEEPTCPISLAPIIIHRSVRTKPYPFVHDPQNRNPNDIEEVLDNPSAQAWVATPCGHAILAWSFGEYVVSQIRRMTIEKELTRAGLTAGHILYNDLTSPVARKRYAECGTGWGMSLAEQVARMCKNAVPPVETPDAPMMPALPTLQEQGQSTIEQLLTAHSGFTLGEYNSMHPVEQSKIKRLMRRIEEATRLHSRQEAYLTRVKNGPGLQAVEYVNSATNAWNALKRRIATTELTYIRKVMISINAAVDTHNSDRTKLEEKKNALLDKSHALTPVRQKELKDLVKSANACFTTTGGCVQVLDALRNKMQEIINKANEIEYELPERLTEAMAEIDSIVIPPAIDRLAAVGTRSLADLTTDDYEVLEEQEVGPFLESVNNHVTTLLRYGNTLDTMVFNRRLAQLTNWFQTKEEYMSNYPDGKVYTRGNKAYQNERVDAAQAQRSLAIDYPVDYGSKIVLKAKRAVQAAKTKLAVAEQAVRLATPR